MARGHWTNRSELFVSKAEWHLYSALVVTVLVYPRAECRFFGIEHAGELSPGRKQYRTTKGRLC